MMKKIYTFLVLLAGLIAVVWLAASRMSAGLKPGETQNL